MVTPSFNNGIVKAMWVISISGSQSNIYADARFIGNATLIMFNNLPSSAQDVTVTIGILYV